MLDVAAANDATVTIDADSTAEPTVDDGECGVDAAAVDEDAAFAAAVAAAAGI